MKPEAQRIAIAEACGWRSNGHCSFYHPKHGQRTCYRTDGNVASVLPDYPADLNAMHEAEKRLSRVQEWDSNGERLPTQWEKYCWLLKFNLDATAAQRAEAFLKILNKWKD